MQTIAGKVVYYARVRPLEGVSGGRMFVTSPRASC